MAGEMQISRVYLVLLFKVDPERSMNFFEKFQNNGGLLTLFSESIMNQNHKVSDKVLPLAGCH